MNIFVLIGQEESMPSTKIAKCISTFLSCLDQEKDKNVVDETLTQDETKTLAEKSSVQSDCYKSFQDCSGSVILIPGLYNETSTENHGNE